MHRAIHVAQLVKLTMDLKYLKGVLMCKLLPELFPLRTFQRNKKAQPCQIVIAQNSSSKTDQRLHKASVIE